MILYGSYTSPYVRHCRIELENAGIQYKFAESDLAASDQGSPTKRVPFLEDGDLRLTDSSSILLHLKQLQGQAGFVDVHDFELYAMVNTIMDTEINLFFLAPESDLDTNNEYVVRQQARVQSGLAQLNMMMESVNVSGHQYTDGQIRLACLLDWGLFRERFSLDNFSALQGFLSTINTWELFESTRP